MNFSQNYLFFINLILYSAYFMLARIHCDFYGRCLCQVLFKYESVKCH